VGVVGVIDPSGTFCRLSRANITVWTVLLDLLVNGSTALMQTSPHGRNWSNRIRPAATPISALRSCSMLGVELSVDAVRLGRALRRASQPRFRATLALVLAAADLSRA